MIKDPEMNWTLGGRNFQSRLLLGTAQFPSLETLKECLLSSRSEIMTLSLRRQSSSTAGAERFWDMMKSLPLTLLPNTAGCRTAKEAVAMAEMSREIFSTHWIKLEVIGDEYNLSPDPFELVKAAKILVESGFEVFPYTTEDIVLAEALLNVGCKILMPWAAPIGSGQGPTNPYGLKTLRQRFPHIPMIVDAGLGKPSHALQVMELGFDGVLLNTAVALAGDPVQMARAFALAVESGHLAYRSGPMPPRELASPSTPLMGRPFWHQSS